ncbi:MAG: 3-deoxy-7-phosphoheptulonate synthase [Proteocatella sp.]
MIVIIKAGTSQDTIEGIKAKLEAKGVGVDVINGTDKTVLCIVGDTRAVDIKAIKSFPEVDDVLTILEPYKKANRLMHPENTVVDVNGRLIGGKKIAVIAGPCSVESEDQIVGIAESILSSGAGFLRGGAFKPRTSPYSFQGLGANGLDLLSKARAKTRLPVVSELMSADMLEKFVEEVDIIQIGARNMQNFDLLKEVGRIKKPILLKRGQSATIEEWLMSAEYIMAGGNNDIILCERGIRTFETSTRNTLDLSAIPVIKKLSHLPVIVDPSHATGAWWMVESLSRAAIAVGADGLIIEVHNDPANALCDGAQSIKPEKFDDLMKSLKGIALAVGREM